MNLLPWEVCRVPIGDDLDDLSVDRDGLVAGRLDVSIKDAKGGVILEEVGGLLHTASVVDGDDVKRGVFSTMPAPQEVPPNPSKSVDGHLQLGLCHSSPVTTTASNLIQPYEHILSLSKGSISALDDHLIRIMHYYLPQTLL